jgi:hypothetical protein
MEASRRHTYPFTTLRLALETSGLLPGSDMNALRPPSSTVATPLDPTTCQWHYYEFRETRTTGPGTLGRISSQTRPGP